MVVTSYSYFIVGHTGDVHIFGHNNTFGFYSQP